MTVHPVATVVERRDTIGQVTIVEVACPFAGHSHVVGVTDGAAVLWCTYTGRTYQVTIDQR